MRPLSETFSALGDDTRLKLVEHLLAHGETPAGTLTDLSGLSAPAVSRHLKVLRTAGILHQRAEGTHRYYSVRPEAMKTVADWTLDHREFWAGSLDRLDTLLALDPEGDTPE